MKKNLIVHKYNNELVCVYLEDEKGLYIAYINIDQMKTTEEGVFFYNHNNLLNYFNFNYWNLEIKTLGD